MRMTAVGDSTDILAAANHPLLWACAIGVFVFIFVQSFIYMRAAGKAVEAADMTQEELRQAFKTGAIAAVGPSLAVVIVAVALLAVFGTPAVLVRIGLIGSAAYETGAAALSAKSMGAGLGTPAYTQNVFAVAFLTMSLGGAMWMIATLIFTPILAKGQKRLAVVNPAVMTIVPAAALMAAFFSLAVAEWTKSMTHVATFVASAIVMGVLLVLGQRFALKWLAEWALGFAIIAGLVVAYVVS